MQQRIPGKTIHAMPTDFRQAVSSDRRALELWKDITPAARNEWICWIISGKRAETRGVRLKKAISKMKGGMRRPCCWSGCPHR